MAKSYVVWVGRNPGVFQSWDECKKQVDGFPGAQYKSFPSDELARAAFDSEPGDVTSVSSPSTIKAVPSSKRPQPPYLTVDAAYSHSTLILEWRGVLVDEHGLQREVFRSPGYNGGSANIGEFIAVVDGLEYLLSSSLSLPVYSDSKTAQAWVRNQAHKSTVSVSDALEKRFNAAMSRLKTSAIQQQLAKSKLHDWDTKTLGEIPADFGRK